MPENTTITLSIADKTYQLKCPQQDAKRLRDAGAYLDNKMRETQSAGNAVGFERTAMMAALDVCFELIGMREEKLTYNDEVKERLEGLSQRISQLLDDNEIDLPAKTIGEQTQLEV